MNKMIEVLIAGFLFCIIVFFLIPMLPAKLGSFVLMVVVFAAIVFVLGLIGGYQWPWNKPRA